MISFFVPGIPQPQGSKSQARDGRMYDAAKGLKGWRRSVTQYARIARGSQPALDCSVVVFARFGLPLNKSGYGSKHGDPHRTVPDLDKLQRAVGDALETSGCITNDSRICMWANPRKIHSANPGVHIRVMTYEEYISSGGAW